MNVKTYSIYDILDTIKKRPGMYVGDISLDNIMVFLFGYEMAMRDAKIEDDSNPNLHEFHEFVRAKYDYFESTAGWANMILAVTIGLNSATISWENYDVGVTFEQHKESVDLFYQLLDEFRAKNA